MERDHPLQYETQILAPGPSICMREGVVARVFEPELRSWRQASCRLLLTLPR
jgi:hypothetical protein